MGVYGTAGAHRTVLKWLKESSAECGYINIYKRSEFFEKLYEIGPFEVKTGVSAQQNSTISKLSSN